MKRRFLTLEDFCDVFCFLFLNRFNYDLFWKQNKINFSICWTVVDLVNFKGNVRSICLYDGGKIWGKCITCLYRLQHRILPPWLTGGNKLCAEDNWVLRAVERRINCFRVRSFLVLVFDLEIIEMCVSTQ